MEWRIWICWWIYAPIGLPAATNGYPQKSIDWLNTFCDYLILSMQSTLNCQCIKCAILINLPCLASHMSQEKLYLIYNSMLSYRLELAHTHTNTHPTAPRKFWPEPSNLENSPRSTFQVVLFTITYKKDIKTMSITKIQRVVNTHL